MTAMLAACYKRPGLARDVLLLEDLNTPVPGPGEVRVKVCVSGVNPADVKRRAGAASRPMVWPIVIPHSDGAGIIDAVGVGVPRSREGERVWMWNAQWARPFGTAAQYVTLPAEHAVALPVQASFEVGASLGVPGLTAHRCVSVLEPLHGKRMLVYGAAGATGHLLVQLAKARGAHVTGVVSSPAKMAVAIELGADAALNYTDPSFVDSLAAFAGGSGFDAIVEVDFGANSGSYTNVLARHGAVVVFGSASNMHPRIDVLPLQKHGVSLHFISGAEQPRAALALAIEEINDRLASGRLRSRVQASFPLTEIVAAHELVEAGGLTGKVVVNIEHAQ